MRSCGRSNRPTAPARARAAQARARRLRPRHRRERCNRNPAPGSAPRRRAGEEDGRRDHARAGCDRGGESRDRPSRGDFGRRAGGRSPRADGDHLLPGSAGSHAYRCCGRTEAGAPDRSGEIARSGAARPDRTVPCDPGCARCRDDVRNRRGPRRPSRRRAPARRRVCRRPSTAADAAPQVGGQGVDGRDPRRVHAARPGGAELRPGLAVRPGPRVALHPRRDPGRRGSTRPPVDPPLSCRPLRRRCVRACGDRPRGDRRQRLRPGPAIRLRLLPGPRERDAARASTPGRHVLAVRRGLVLRPGRRLPRSSPHLPGTAIRAVRRVRDRVRSRVRRSAARVHVAGRCRPRTRRGARCQSRGPRAAVHRLPQHRAASLRLALDRDPRRDTPGAPRLAPPPARRDHARKRRDRRRLEHRDVLLLPRRVRGDHRGLARRRGAGRNARLLRREADRGCARRGRARDRCHQRRRAEPRRGLAEVDRVPEPRHSLRHARIRLVADSGLVSRLSRRSPLRPLVGCLRRDPARRARTA